MTRFCASMSNSMSAERWGSDDRHVPGLVAAVAELPNTFNITLPGGNVLIGPYARVAAAAYAKIGPVIRNEAAV